MLTIPHSLTALKTLGSYAQIKMLAAAPTIKNSLVVLKTLGSSAQHPLSIAVRQTDIFMMSKVIPKNPLLFGKYSWVIKWLQKLLL